MDRARPSSLPKDADTHDVKGSGQLSLSDAGGRVDLVPTTPPALDPEDGDGERRAPHDPDVHASGSNASESTAVRVNWEDAYDSTDFACKYDFRQKPREANPLYCMTWLDEDDTGNFDPNEARRAERAARIKRQRVTPKERYQSGSVPQERRHMRVPKQTPTLIIVLHFHSESARADVAKILGKESAAASPAKDDASFGYSLRSKKDVPEDIEGNAHPLSESRPDLTGHPAARGCWGCYDLGLRCPLIDNELQWPCDCCKDDGDECELITAPKVKRCCEECKRKRTRCSFTMSFDHQGPCRSCKENERVCIAGPAVDSQNARHRYGQGGANAIGTKSTLHRPPVEICQHCTKAPCVCSPQLEQSASIDLTRAYIGPVVYSPRPDKDKALKEPTGVAKQSLSCPQQSQRPAATQPERREPPKEKEVTVEARSEVQRWHKKRMSMPNSSTLQPSKTSNTSTQLNPTASGHAVDVSNRQNDTRIVLPPTVDRDIDPASASITTIFTRFSHPIQFNYEDRYHGLQPCHFCSEAGYRLFGLGAKPAVRVMDMADGRGLTELRGGHRADGLLSTRVCTACTLERLRIVACRRHRIRVLPHIVPGVALDSAAAWDELTRPMPPGGLTHLWCSVCPSLATYGCKAAGKVHAPNGCGLLLCEQCRSQLVGLFGGDLQEMLTVLRDGPTPERSLGLRADATLLKRDGLLMRFVMHNCE